MDPALQVRPLDREHLRRAGIVLAASHLEDPAYRYLFSDPTRRLRVMRTLYTELVRDALPFDAVYGAFSGTQLAGVAIWLPPGQFPLSLVRKVRGTPAILSVGLQAPRSFSAFTRMGTTAEKLHPRTPMWYLEGLGVEPQAQGKGLGTQLLGPVLARADAQRTPCYLETANRRNLAFYERLGFRVDNDALALIPDGPTHWSMVRPPATSV